MPTTTVQPPDLESSGLSLSSHQELWDQYAQAALKGLLSFHGAHPSNKDGIPEFAAHVADQMMVQRAARTVAHKAAKETARKGATK